jgi:hypothetical protein
MISGNVRWLSETRRGSPGALKRCLWGLPALVPSGPHVRICSGKLASVGYESSIQRF